jgi:glyoxylase-like metal-dependent hydrolase (beta-lactamase superfamily II)
MKHLVEEDARLEGIYWVEDAGACSGVYVLEEGRTLVDVGNMYGLADELENLGGGAKVERILLTHCHFDHVGGMAEIYQLATPELCLHRIAREYLRLIRMPFPDFFDALERDGRIRFLGDGDIIGERHPLRVFHTPGHTSGDLCFFHEPSGALFSGDTVLPHRFRQGAALSRPDETCGGRLAEKTSSLRRLLGLPVRHLMAGHGAPVFHKGLDQIKISLFNLYQSQQEEHPQRAWLIMGNDLLALGQWQEARQCADKAQEINPDDPEVGVLRARIADAAVEH